jgi:hypothetical protein
VTNWGRLRAAPFTSTNAAGFVLLSGEGLYIVLNAHPRSVRPPAMSSCRADSPPSVTVGRVTIEVGWVAAAAPEVIGPCRTSRGAGSFFGRWARPRRNKRMNHGPVENLKFRTIFHQRGPFVTHGLTLRS